MDEGKRRRLLWHGVLLSVLGLVTGFAVPALPNPRMGLSSHLAGLMGGVFLILFGLLWRELSLGPRAERCAFWAAITGNYANWGAVLVAAVFRTSRMTPLAGSLGVGPEWAELLVSAGLVFVSVATLAASVLVLWGLRRPSSR